MPVTLIIDGQEGETASEKKVPMLKRMLMPKEMLTKMQIKTATMPFGPRTCEILVHTHIYTLLTADVRRANSC